MRRHEVYWCAFCEGERVSCHPILIPAPTDGEPRATTLGSEILRAFSTNFAGRVSLGKIHEKPVQALQSR